MMHTSKILLTLMGITEMRDQQMIMSFAKKQKVHFHSLDNV